MPNNSTIKCHLKKKNWKTGFRLKYCSADRRGFVLKVAMITNVLSAGERCFISIRLLGNGIVCHERIQTMEVVTIARMVPMGMER